MSGKNINNAQAELNDNMLDDVVGGGNGDGEYVLCSCGEMVLKSDLNKHMKKCPNNPYK